ncbi:MAG: helix-turn-helix domain-containing protein [Methylococcales bacterium]
MPESEITLYTRIPSCGLEAYRIQQNYRNLGRFSLEQHHIILYLGHPGSRWIVKSGGKRFDTRQQPGELAFGGAGEEFESEMDGTVQDDFHVVISPESFEREIDEMGTSSKRIQIITQIGIRNPAIEQPCIDLMREIGEGNPCGPVFLEHISIMLFESFAAVNSTASSGPRSGSVRLPKYKLSRIFEYVHAHLADNDKIKLEILAKEVGLSKFHFVRSFTASTGITPHQFVMQQRLACAKCLLADRDRSITDIAAEVGYAPSQLSALFRRSLGISPYDYRNKKRKSAVFPLPYKGASGVF